jgi:hypothetical protein
MFRIIHTIYRDYFLNINRLVSVIDTVFSVSYEMRLYNTMHINVSLASYAMAQAIGLRH